MGGKITDLMAAPFVGPTDSFEVVHVGNTRRCSGQQIADMAFANPGGVLAVDHGGTGADDATDALTNLLPDQTGQAGKVLATNGTVTSWQSVSAGLTALDSPSSTATVSAGGGTGHVDINLAHANTWTGAQAFHSVSGSPDFAALMPDVPGGWAGSLNCSVGTPSAVHLASNNLAAEFICGAATVQIAGAAAALNVTGNVTNLMGGLRHDGLLTFFNGSPTSQLAANQALNDLTGGSSGTTLGACGDTSAGDQSGPINNNFASLAARLAEIRSLLLGYSLGS